jgi:outer membrane protein
MNEGVMRKFWAAVSVTTALFMAPAVQSETLADALIAAYKTSNLLDQNQAVLRAADEDAAIALAKLRPVLSYTISETWRKNDDQPASIFSPAFEETSSGQAQLTASLLIYAGGRGKLGIDIAREAVLATRAALVNVEQQVLLAAVSAYVDVRLQSEIVALQESNVRLISQELRAAKDRFDVGEVTLTDVSLADARRAQAQASLASAQGNLMIARERYKATTGAYPGNLAGLPKLPATAKSQEAARAIAVRAHPSIIQAQHQARISDLQVRIAKGAFLPTVNGQVGVTETFAGAGNTSVGLSMSQTLYAGGELSAEYRKSLASKESAEAGLHQSAVVVTENLGRAWASLAVANASIEAGSQQVVAAQKAFDGVREEAKLGARTTLDVLNSDQELLSARATKLQAEANRYVGVYQVLSAMGLLTAEHLKLGIPTFDPEAYYNAVKNAPATSTQGKRLDKILKTLGK